MICHESTMFISFSSEIFGYTSHRADTVTVVVIIVDTSVEMFTRFFKVCEDQEELAQIALRPYPKRCFYTILLLSIYSQNEVIDTYG